VGGSIVLAGVLLKLGSYGLLIFLPFVKLNPLLTFYYSLRLLGSLACALTCTRQGDLKLLIAYSSVVHIGVVSIGFISGTELGYTCGTWIVLAHGLCSPFLFCYAYCLYLNTHSRIMINNTSSSPFHSTLLLILVSMNMGLPPRLGL